MQISGHTKAFFAIILVIAGLSILQSVISVKAYIPPPIQSSDNDHSIVQQQTAEVILTPTPFPSEFTEQELAEGQPIGIIIGAAILVLMIILGTVFTLGRIKNRR
jgi:hypothetical protein